MPYMISSSLVADGVSLSVSRWTHMSGGRADSIHTTWRDTDNTASSRLAGDVNWALEDRVSGAPACDGCRRWSRQRRTRCRRRRRDTGRLAGGTVRAPRRTRATVAPPDTRRRSRSPRIAAARARTHTHTNTQVQRWVTFTRLQQSMQFPLS